MGEQYTQSLIPQLRDFTPSPTQVEAFYVAILDMGVVPGEPSILRWTLSGKFREGHNPFTGEPIRWETKDCLALPKISDVSGAIEGLEEYEVDVSGKGRPRTPPLPIDFEGPYHVGVICRVFRAFTDPRDWGIITVPGADCARFWLGFELGKFLFPTTVSDDLDLLDPTIVNAAERIFRVRFVQGYSWA